MIELIDRSKLEPDTEWNEYYDDYMSYSAVQIKTAPTVKAVPLDKVKDAREEIQKLRGCSCTCSDGIIDDIEDILDKLIESEEE